MRTTVTLDEVLVERAVGLSGIADRGALLRAALQALIERETALRLAALAGSEPDLVAPPRPRAA